MDDQTETVSREDAKVDPMEVARLTVEFIEQLNIHDVAWIVNRVVEMAPPEEIELNMVETVFMDLCEGYVCKSFFGKPSLQVGDGTVKDYFRLDAEPEYKPIPLSDNFAPLFAKGLIFLGRLRINAMKAIKTGYVN